MTKQHWRPAPPKRIKPKLPDRLKAEVETRANQLVDTALKTAYIKPPAKNERFNYVIDIFTKWHHSYFYFCAKYCCPGPNAIAPFFETRFARLAYIGGNRFGLSYMRHTGQWWEIYPDLSLDECLSSVRNEPHFQP